MTPNFSLAELTKTKTGLPNVLPAELALNLYGTAQMLERIRAALSTIAGKPIPIVISSAYRSHAVNAAVGGSAKSDHMQALAADFRAPAFGTPYQVCKALAPQVEALGVGQLIHEFGQWVHVSSKPTAKPSNRVITISAAGTELGVQEVGVA
jgi:zinc D-Ala-D-Ala carboxypeptidase